MMMAISRGINCRRVDVIANDENGRARKLSGFGFVSSESLR